MWIPITLAAATFQILRTSRQHELRSVLSAVPAGFVRYLYGAPLALAAAFAVFLAVGRPVPEVPWRFWPIAVGAGVAQILGTVALLLAFRVRDFAVGTVYAKSEVILVAVVGALALSEPLRPLGWVGAIACTAGVAWLAARGDWRSLVARAGDPAALLGLAAGAGFAVAATGIRAASTSLTGGTAAERALVTLTVMLTSQTLVNGAYLAVRAPDELADTFRAWRPAVPVGILSLLGSAGWALAVTLENAAKVRTLGQVELVIAFVIARVALGERHRRDEYLASALVLAGIVAVVALG